MWWDDFLFVFYYLINFDLFDYYFDFFLHLKEKCLYDGIDLFLMILLILFIMMSIGILL